MIIFFDCEFSELGLDPRLISIGFISACGTREFYAELSDSYQPKDSSAFVQEAVLPLLQGGDAIMTMHKLSVRLVEWLISFNEPVQLATDSISWDWPWIGEIYAEAGEGTDWPAHMTTQGKAEVFRPSNVAAQPLILTHHPCSIWRSNAHLKAVCAAITPSMMPRRIGWHGLQYGMLAMEKQNQKGFLYEKVLHFRSPFRSHQYPHL